MSFKTKATLVGNTLVGTGDAAANAGIVPTSQPVGTKFIAFGEGGSSEPVNRALAAVAQGTDHLYQSLMRPLATVTRLSGATQLQDPGPNDRIDLLADSAFDGWVYHRSGIAATVAPTVAKVVDTVTGEEALDGTGVAITVTDILDTAAGTSNITSPPNERLLGGGKTLSAPVVVTDRRDEITLSGGGSLSELDSKDPGGLFVAISGSTPNNGLGTNDGNYGVLRQVDGAAKVFLLGEVRYRVRLTNPTAAVAFTVGREIRDTTSGARMTIVAKAADYIEGTAQPVDVNSTPRVFTQGIANGIAEYNAGVASGVVATCLRYSEPRDSVMLNNDMTGAPQTAQFRYNGTFSRKVTLQLSAVLPKALTTYTVVIGKKSNLLEGAADLLLGGSAGDAPDPSGEMVEKMTLDGAYDWSANPASAAGGGRTVIVDAGPVVLAGGAGDTVREGLLELKQSAGQSKTLHLRSDAVGAASQQRQGLVIDGYQDFTTASGAPISLVDVRIPLYGNNNIVAAGNAVAYAFAAGEYTLTFQQVGGLDPNLVAFEAASPASGWPYDAFVVEIAGATHPVLNGLWRTSGETVGPPSTFKLKRVDGGGMQGDLTGGVGGNATVRFYGRGMVVRGRMNGSETLLGLTLTQGERGLVITRTGSTASQVALWVRDGVGQSDVLRVMLDDTVNSSDADYAEAIALHSDKLRSKTNPLAAGAAGTTVLDLSSTAAATFKLCRGLDGGDPDDTAEVSALTLFRNSAREHHLWLRSPTAFALGEGQSLHFELGEDVSFNVLGQATVNYPEWQIGSHVVSLTSGLAQAVFLAATLKLENGASAINNTYTGKYAYIIAGTGVGQVRYIADYTGADRTCYITPNWTTTPNGTSKYQIFSRTDHLAFRRTGGSQADDLESNRSVIRVPDLQLLGPGGKLITRGLDLATYGRATTGGAVNWSFGSTEGTGSWQWSITDNGASTQAILRVAIPHTAQAGPNPAGGGGASGSAARLVRLWVTGFVEGGGTPGNNRLQARLVERNPNGGAYAVLSTTTTWTGGEGLVEKIINVTSGTTDPDGLPTGVVMLRDRQYYLEFWPAQSGGGDANKVRNAVAVSVVTRVFELGAN